MDKTVLYAPTAYCPQSTRIALTPRDDPADTSPTTATIGYARWRMPAEMPVYRPRGEDPGADTAWAKWDEQEELVRRAILAEHLDQIRAAVDPAPSAITWTRDGGRLAADATLTINGHPHDLAITEPGR